MTSNTPWQELFKAAMLELDSVKLQENIEAAVSAIQERMDELKLSGPDVNSAEVQRMYDALSALRTLHRMESRVAEAPHEQRGQDSNGETR